MDRKQAMADRLAVVVNGELQLEYDRDIALAGRQREYLDVMDKKMSTGIEYNGVLYADPDQNQRAQFVTINLIKALLANDEQQMMAMCAYLALRLPKLKQVQAQVNGTAFSVDLVFDRPHQSQVTVQFDPVRH